MSFRRRLALTTTSILVVGYVAFALISLAVLEGRLRSEQDARLTTIARAAADIVDDNNGQPSVDADDVGQLNALHENDEHIGIYSTSGRLIFGERAPSAKDSGRYSIVHVQAIHNGHRLGSVHAFRDMHWIATVRFTAMLAFTLAGSVLAVLCFFFYGIYARALLRPIEQVAHLAERIETSDLSERLNVSGRDEIGRLCASFDRMLERLQASFESERRFVSDASHELRAPLSVVRAETDLALRRERSSDEYRAALRSIDRETKRLEELVDDLLQTMRRQTIVQTRILDVREIVAQLSLRLRSAAQAIAVDCRTADSLVRADAPSLERAISAVLHNAVIHGGGAIAVTIDGVEETVVVQVADQGPGFTPDALAHATERFWRGDGARSRGSTGLGLAIARILIEAHGGTVVLSNGARGGAVVTLTLPRAAETAASV